MPKTHLRYLLFEDLIHMVRKLFKHGQPNVDVQLYLLVLVQLFLCDSSIKLLIPGKLAKHEMVSQGEQSLHIILMADLLAFESSQRAKHQFAGMRAILLVRLTDLELRNDPEVN